MIAELDEIATDAINVTQCTPRGPFRSFLCMAAKSLQMGNYGEAEHNLQKAYQQWASGSVGEIDEARLLYLQIHLAWYQRRFSDALEKAHTYLKLVDRGLYQDKRVYAQILLGNLYRDAEQWSVAHFWYAEAQKSIEEINEPSYAPALDGQLTWLYLLERRFTHAWRQIEVNRGRTNQSQAMHFQVILAILQMLDGEWETAEDLLNEALTFYEQTGDPLACCALHLYLAYNALHQHTPTKFLAHANYALGWLSEHQITTFPRWWHPKIMAEICVHALMSDLHATLIEQILVNHLGQAARPALKLLENTEDIDLRRKVNRLHQIITGLDVNPLSHLNNTPSKRVLHELLDSGDLRHENYSHLEQELMTATHRQRPNATLMAVFGLYVNGLAREDIAKRLECSIENVRNYITIIYQHFALPSYRFKGREQRRQKLIEVARARGYIY